jgi:hypothetical protein
MRWLVRLFTGKSNPIREIMDGIDNLHTSDEEKAALRASVVVKSMEARASVIVAEAQAGGLAANWRPITMLSFGGMLWWYILSATFGWPPPDLSTVPAELWTMLHVGIGGYIAGRTGEKIVKKIVDRKR